MERALERLGGGLILALALAWLPGQAREGAVRLWVAVGVLPLLVALRGVPLGRWTWPWLGLAVFSLMSVVGAADPGSALAVALVQLGGAAALALAPALPTTARLGPWVAAAGVAAALPALVSPQGSGAYGNPDFLAGFLAATAVWTASLGACRAYPDRARCVAAGRGQGAKPQQYREYWKASQRRDRPVDACRAKRSGMCARLPGLRPWMLAALAVQVSALVLAQSLGAGLALGVGLAALLFLRLGRRGRLLLLTGVALAAVATLLSADVRAHLAGRAHLWRVALDVAGGTFPLGTGAGALHPAFLEAQTAYGAAHWTNAAHAHNELVHALAEQGPLGLVLLALPVLAALRRPAAGAPWAVVAAVATLALVSLPLYEPSTAALAALATGLCLRGPPSPAATGVRRTLAVGIAALALALATADLAGDRLLARGARTGDPQVLDLAATLSLRSTRALLHAAEARAATDPYGGLLRAAEAVARDPGPRAWALVGRVAVSSHAPELALAAYTEAARLHPRLFAAHFNLAVLYRDAGDLVASRRHATRARSLRPTDERLRALPR